MQSSKKVNFHDVYICLLSNFFVLWTTHDWFWRGKSPKRRLPLMVSPSQTWEELQPTNFQTAPILSKIDSEMAKNAYHCLVPSLQSRQLGILSPRNFSRDTSGSCGLVKRLTLHDKLVHHDGCVNTLHFNMSGDLLASGSDDLEIVIWDWAKGKKKIAYQSGHSSNVFQVK